MMSGVSCRPASVLHHHDSPHPRTGDRPVIDPSGDGPVLQVADVDVVRDGHRLLQSISLTVRQGEHWALLGANGAGKSTLLDLLGAVTHPTRGVVEVLG